MNRFVTKRIVFLMLLLAIPATSRETDDLQLDDLKNSSLYPLTYSVAGMGIQFATLWAWQYKPSVDNFINAYRRPPEWENDHFLFNYVLHPLWGSETYLRGREAGYGMAGSFAFSMAMSVAWEYLFESWLMHPSAQDLILTTGLGWALGELRYRNGGTYGTAREWVFDPVQSIVETISINWKVAEMDGRPVALSITPRSLTVTVGRL